MEQLHTEQEIKYFDDMNQCANELMALSNKYKQSACTDLADEYKQRVTFELNKYSHLIGKKVSGVKKYRNNEPFIGVISSISHFNANTKSVRVNVRYSDGGFDGCALKDLTLIKE